MKLKGSIYFVQEEYNSNDCLAGINLCDFTICVVLFWLSRSDFDTKQIAVMGLHSRIIDHKFGTDLHDYLTSAGFQTTMIRFGNEVKDDSICNQLIN